ncbi:DnaD domain protein [Macrococcus brunensis]|uniref:DnaD domain protein n=1 Tax=Macrococcus brunensis TaxID=198483 RepID=A0A4R6BD45_9STAP|nr:DnaD domain protein [Macrococcus brunensis]TDL96712.1 DnaD domain protein [Macrococcus brunensis]
MTEDILKSSVSGYGLVFKNVMKDQNLDIEAKALYSYLSSYAGSNGVAFPGVDLICHELKVSEKRYKKYRKQLEDAGYLTIKRNRRDSGFSNNIYHINHQGLSGQNDTVTLDDNETLSGQNVPLQIVPEQNVSEQIVTGQNVGTKNNSITNNSITNNNNKNNNLISNSSRSDINSENKIDSVTTTTDNEFKEVYNSYQENIQMNPPPNVNQKLKQDFEAYGKDLILYAIYRSSLKNNYNYTFIDHLLNDWRKKRITTVEQAKRYEERHDTTTVKVESVKEYTPEQLLQMDAFRNQSEDMWSFMGVQE